MPRKRKLLAELSALQSNSSIPPSDALENLNTTPDGDSSPKSSKYFATEKKKSFQLEADFFSQPCISLAKSFLGQILVRRLPDGRELWGRIVETEAYLGGEDEASHSKGGKQTQRNAAMFMKPGTLYVYQIYGIYFCVNVSSQEEGEIFVYITEIKLNRGTTLEEAFPITVSGLILPEAMECITAWCFWRNHKR